GRGGGGGPGRGRGGRRGGGPGGGRRTSPPRVRGAGAPPGGGSGGDDGPAGPPFRVAVTVDVVALTVRADRLEVLLVRRAGEPYRGSWALPGGVVQAGGSPAPAGAPGVGAGDGGGPPAAHPGAPGHD